MVLLHALEHGQVPIEPSQDGDVIADVRAGHQAITQVVRQLYRLGFTLENISTDGLAHRYSRAAYLIAYLGTLQRPQLRSCCRWPMLRGRLPAPGIGDRCALSVVAYRRRSRAATAESSKHSHGWRTAEGCSLQPSAPGRRSSSWRPREKFQACWSRHGPARIWNGQADGASTTMLPIFGA
jgi:hypothetical protein